MTLNRKHKLVAALVAALVGVPSLAAPLMTAPHPCVWVLRLVLLDGRRRD
jgi:hypothetical protein